ncbi:MAG: KUP/HAK/KT family potassium transporter, partial [Alphaproteobacteria bacterium]|nr:KUP/HAK/KT family potassium transporter [Alphaproteobacteria bacterium]
MSTYYRSSEAFFKRLNVTKTQLDLRKLTIGALGIVYGDIGTSPLYTFKECLNAHNMQAQQLEVLGILSLIFWSILIVICIKYAIFVLRADNRGEGGILALTALLHQHKRLKYSSSLIFIGMFGAALFCGDGLITPAISVLGALEGLVVVSPHFESVILPLAIAILICLFLAQKHGTAKIGIWFGPIMMVWFMVIGILGFIQILQTPNTLKALNPIYGIYLLINNGFPSLLILGTTVLALTGAEAMYADLGHFGKKPIRIAWFYLVCPCLLLNYFGQAALLLKNPAAIENPFYLLAPSWALYPLIVLATIATIIASQSIISGIFSIGWQALQLGYLPRLRILHTSAKQIG